MAELQIKSGFTRIPNELLESLCALGVSGNEMRIMLWIIRKTYGFNRTSAELPLSEIAKAVGMRTNHVSESLKKLEEMGLINRRNSQGVQPQVISVEADTGSQKQEFPKTVTVPENGNTEVPENGNPDVPENRNANVPENGNDTYKEIKERYKEKRRKIVPRGEYGNVRLTDEEFTKLSDDYGESVAKDYINRVDRWVQSTGRSFSDYDATIRLWLQRDGVEKDSFDMEKYRFVINNIP
ncbi:replication protein [Ruminococcus sp. XPD3002]|uniref:replication protein n=1 Tax=Ruminococcus sp. XPD3002 TaxID=1452269 RepID=UPI0009104215|nr:phage replication protein O [Ruminococcus flavefaciens]